VTFKVTLFCEKESEASITEDPFLVVGAVNRVNVAVVPEVTVIDPSTVPTLPMPTRPGFPLTRLITQPPAGTGFDKVTMQVTGPEPPMIEVGERLIDVISSPRTFNVACFCANWSEA
jgi:hypothetical protein